MKNNIFNFATAELTQDAMICWIANWFNDLSNPEMRELSKEFVSAVSGFDKDEIGQVEVFRQLSSVYYADGKRYPVKIDVLLVVNNVIAVIIEDKTYTTEHNDQINVYRTGLQKMIEDGDTRVNYVRTIRTVYLKTGFFNDYDRAVVADESKINLVLKRRDLLQMFDKFRSAHPLLAEYLEYLEEIDENEKTAEKYWTKEVKGNYYAESSHIGQYALLRDIFQEERFEINPGKAYEPYQIYHGSSYGRPWTQMIVYNGRYADGKGYELFWRVDNDAYGPYISLRLHEGAKQFGNNRENHRILWEKLRRIVDDILQENRDELCFTALDNVDPGNKGGYNEASIFHLHIHGYLNIWEEKGRNVIDSIRKVNDLLLERIKE